MMKRRPRRGSPASASGGKRGKVKDVSDVEDASDEDFVPSSSSESDSDCGGKRTYPERKGKSQMGELRDADESLVEFLELHSDSGEDNTLAAKSGKRTLGNTRSQGKAARTSRKKRHKKSSKRDVQLFWEIWQGENEKWLDDHEEEEFVLDGADESLLAETADPSSDLIVPLLQFQREWLAWALKQEQSEIRGGILADEMGMGKTIQAISLVLTARSVRGECSDLTSTFSTSLPKIRATLVICPVVAVTQWVNEIARFTKEGSSKVLVYHGPQRGNGGPERFSGYDFVITTYAKIEADYRRFVMAPKERCEWCGKLFKADKIKTHQQYYCGPDAVKTEKQSKQVRKRGNKTQGSFSGKDFCFEEDKKTGSNSLHKAGLFKKKAEEKNKETMLKDVMRNADQGATGQRSILHSVTWERIILDEAHFIKDRRSNTARAVLSLESTYKWALSGTPLQNRIGELYSLVRFLQVIPYSYYFCKDCDCKSLDHSASMQCKNCEHKSMRHFCWWNRHIAVPIQKYGYEGEGRRAMILLKQKLLPTIVLRRTKKGRAADLALPPRIVFVRRDSFDNKEEDFYQALYSESQAQFNTYVNTRTLLNNYAHIFDLLTRLRQAVDHPYLVIYSRTSNMNTADQNVTEAQTCGICREEAEDPLGTACNHWFCKACLMDYSQALGQVSCPSCSKPLTVDFSAKKSPKEQDTVTTVKGYKRSSILNRLRLEDFQSSTKIEALREEIRFMVESDGSAKGIVFSQFTSFLDLINYSLQKSGINCVQLVGSMTMAQRDEAIRRFTEDPDCRIFLMSLKAGGVALNLTVASHVFLMDPWWNPAVEQQAQDRIHRIGQYKPIRTVRFVIESTIEERILKLQEKKQLVFEGTVGGSLEALGRLTEADMRFLFQM